MTCFLLCVSIVLYTCLRLWFTVCLRIVCISPVSFLMVFDSSLNRFALVLVLGIYGLLESFVRILSLLGPSMHRVVVKLLHRVLGLLAHCLQYLLVLYNVFLEISDHDEEVYV
jgi:uncharacterized membrane protein required for colicin V production